MNKAKSEQIKKTNATRQAFLLTFFDDKSSKQQVERVNGFFLVKHHNGNTDSPEVAIMSPSGYLGWKKWQEASK